MPLRIQGDHNRFKNIVKGKIRENLKKFITNGELMGKQGDKKISIPLPQIELPRFKFDEQKQGGAGQGDGDVGDPIDGGSQEKADGKEAGDKEGEHALEVDITLDELAEILGEELGLPRIEPRGNRSIQSKKIRYTGINKQGPESLRHTKRTFKESLKRQIVMGSYNPDRPVIIPIKEDKRFRSFKIHDLPENNAVIVYMMDVSGSMGEEQKQIVRIESFWIETWLKAHYQGLEFRYIIHDAVAKEVDRHTFFHTKESGGTMISSAYKLCLKILDDNYSPEDWNIYTFHFSDGDNWSTDDSMQCIKILKEDIIPKSNLFGYGQVDSPYGSGQFIKDLKNNFDDPENMVLSEIKGKDGIYHSIKEFLGKGK